MLRSFGVNVIAVLAGLGIGGIAVALAAQKTVENFIGGITLYADQPVRVGEFCRFGGTIGTVEDVGLRSTRVRTLERTIVTIPNSEFSNLQIENFERRDCIWYGRHWYRAERSSLPQHWLHVLAVGDGWQTGHGFVRTPCASERLESLRGWQCCPAALPLQAALQQWPGDSLHTHSLPFGFCHEPAGGGVIDLIKHDHLGLVLPRSR